MTINQQDLDKVRQFLSIMKIEYPGSTGNSSDFGPARQQAFSEMNAGATALVKYYYTKIEPDNGEKNYPGTGDRPYEMTKTERALAYLKSWHGPYGMTFPEKYPSLLTEALEHYEQESKQKHEQSLEQALGQTLENMTGEQLLLLLDEHDRRKSADRS